MKNINVKESVCPNCGKVFLSRRKSRTGNHNPPNVRPFGVLTCSPKCSKEWNSPIARRNRRTPEEVERDKEYNRNYLKSRLTK